MTEGDIPKRVREVIGEVGLEVKTDSMIAGLSRGMKQRLGIACAIIHKSCCWTSRPQGWIRKRASTCGSCFKDCASRALRF
jgi:ABC-type ATPase involved in cell division